MKVLCIGSASYDISILTDGFPNENIKYRLNKKIECPGGSALTAALLLGLWDVDVYYSGIIGNDIYSESIINETKKNNVNTKFTVKASNIETPKSFILINKENASRTLFNVFPNIKLQSPLNYDCEPDIILMDGDYSALSLSAIQKYPNAIKIIEASKITEEVTTLCRISDYIICSKEFAELITKERINYKEPNSLKNVLNKLSSYFKGQIIVTQEEKGCLYKVEDKIKMMSGLKVFASDTTGAGDIFLGAFTYGLTKKLPLEKCLKIANIAAGLSVKKIGSSYSIPEVEEVYKIYEKNR